MRFELDLTRPPADEKRAVELQHWVEAAIRAYWRDHDDLNPQDVHKAIRLVQEQIDTGGDLAPGRLVETLLDDGDPGRWKPLAVFIGLAMIVAAAVSFFLIRRP